MRNEEEKDDLLLLETLFTNSFAGIASLTNSCPPQSSVTGGNRMALVSLWNQMGLSGILAPQGSKAVCFGWPQFFNCK